MTCAKIAILIIKGGSCGVPPLQKQFFFPTNSAGSQLCRNCPSSQGPAPLCLTHLITCVSDGFQAWMDLGHWAPGPSEEILRVWLRQTHPGDGGTAWGPGVLLLRGSRNCWQQQSGLLLQIAPRKPLQTWRSEWFSSLINRFSTLGPGGGQCKRHREA